MSGVNGFSIGIAGLNNSAKAIEVVSSNISNANTIGFKGANYTFAEEFFRTVTSGGSNSTATAISGASVRRSFAQGSITTSTSSLDLAINGSGFFRLSSKPGTDPGDLYYTRNGQCSVDKDGYIVNSSGLYLTGFKANARGNAITNDVVALQVPPSQNAPQETESVVLSTNFDARTPIKVDLGATTPKNFNPDDDTTFAHSTAFTIYDAAGNKSSVKVYFRRVEDDPQANFADENGKSVDANGAPIYHAAQVYKSYISITDVDGNTTWVKGSSTDQSTATYNTTDEVPSGADTATDYFAVKTLKFFGGENTDAIWRDTKTGESYNKTELSFNIVTGDGTNSQPIKVDLTGTTRYSADFEVKNLSQDGYPVGTLNSVNVDESGQLFGIYSNGRVLLAGQAVVAKFKSADGLNAVGQNLYAQTVNSGEALLGVAGGGGNGVVRSSALEEANIDMASQLVSLMIQQRNYQANAESIRAQDEVLKSTISLSR